MDVFRIKMTTEIQSALSPHYNWCP